MIASLMLVFLLQVPDAVKNEPLPEKRYLLALDAAAKALVDSSLESGKAKLELAADLTEFALSSLEAMGKPAHKNAGNYKKAELRTRELLRRVDAIVKEASIDERPGLESAQNRINVVHEKVLDGVMSKKP